MNQIAFYGMPTETEDGEVWRVIEDFPDYLISSHGRVWSVHKNGFMSLFLSNGYYCIVLCTKKRRKKMYIHRLIAEAFIPNPENKPVVNHINGVKTDNSLGNLEWVTSLENNIHAIETGLRKDVLDKSVQEELKSLFSTGEYTQTELARKFGLSKACVAKHVKGIDSPTRHKRGICYPETVKRKMADLYASGKYNMTEIANMYGVERGVVSRNIKKYRTESVKPKKSPNHLNPETQKELVSRYMESDISVKELGSIYGVSSRTIYRLIKEFGQIRPGKYSENMKKEIATAYAKGGITMQQLADNYHVSLERVSVWTKEYN